MKWEANFYVLFRSISRTRRGIETSEGETHIAGLSHRIPAQILSTARGVMTSPGVRGNFLLIHNRVN